MNIINYLKQNKCLQGAFWVYNGDNRRVSANTLSGKKDEVDRRGVDNRKDTEVIFLKGGVRLFYNLTDKSICAAFRLV